MDTKGLVAAFLILIMPGCGWAADFVNYIGMEFATIPAGSF